MLIHKDFGFFIFCDATKKGDEWLAAIAVETPQPGRFCVIASEELQRKGVQEVIGVMLVRSL